MTANVQIQSVVNEGATFLVIITIARKSRFLFCFVTRYFRHTNRAAAAIDFAFGNNGGPDSQTFGVTADLIARAAACIFTGTGSKNVQPRPPGRSAGACRIAADVPREPRRRYRPRALPRATRTAAVAGDWPPTAASFAARGRFMM